MKDIDQANLEAAERDELRHRASACIELPCTRVPLLLRDTVQLDVLIDLCLHLFVSPNYLLLSMMMICV